MAWLHEALVTVKVMIMTWNDVFNGLIAQLSVIIFLMERFKIYGVERHFQ